MVGKMLRSTGRQGNLVKNWVERLQDKSHCIALICTVAGYRGDVVQCDKGVMESVF